MLRGWWSSAQRWAVAGACIALAGCSLVFSPGDYTGTATRDGGTDAAQDAAADAAQDGSPPPVDGGKDAMPMQGTTVAPSYVTNDALILAGGEDPFAGLTAGTYFLDTTDGKLWTCSDENCATLTNDEQLVFADQAQEGLGSVAHLAILLVGTLTLPEDVVVHVVGARPLVILAAGAATVAGTFDLGPVAARNRVGAGGRPGMESGAEGAKLCSGLSGALRDLGQGGCGKSVQKVVMNTGGNSGGGGGSCGLTETHRGGFGGAAYTAAGNDLLVEAGYGGFRTLPNMSKLIGGGGGGAGGHYGGRPSTPGGHGGGALLLASNASITITGTGTVTAPGGGGGVAEKAADKVAAGGGGGAGGMIVLEAPEVRVAGHVAVTGGGGGGGDRDGAADAHAVAGERGGVTVGGSGGAGVFGPATDTLGKDDGDGGDGAAMGTPVGAMGCSKMGCVAGGGGGSGGRILVHSEDYKSTGSLTSEPELGALQRFTPDDE